MPTSKQQRAKRPAEDISDASTEPEEEDEAQTQSKSRSLKKSKGAKRGSFMVQLNDSQDQDASFASSSKGPSGDSPFLQRQSSSMAALNDDAAEKRQRRKSAKQSIMLNNNLDGDEQDTHEGRGGPPGSSRPGTPERSGVGASGVGLRTPKKSVLARANQLNSVDQTPVPAVSMDVMSSNFEEWMKMATDNKINAGNAWNFALIDYFQDMSLLRNERDNSINFQKASFTLDGCVKIWTSRVDSVGTETGKLLSNLADEVRGAQAGEDGEEQGEDGETQKAKRTKTHRPEATLAKSITQLQVKKLDLEFTVDPLFKKTSADFDEGGAMGLLMNHLGVDENIRVVFDAGDAKLDNFDVEETADVASIPIDLSEIRAKFIPSVDSIVAKTISDSLADFRFSSDGSNNMAILNSFSQAYDENDDGASSHGGDEGGFAGAEEEGGFFPNEDNGDQAAEDFFTGDQAVEDDYVTANQAGTGPGTGGGPLGPVEAFDPRRMPNERDLVMALNEDGNEMLGYFDAAVMKNWAGPEHWKLRKVVRKPEPAAEGGGPRAKKEKQAFTIDFSSPSSTSSKELFTPANRSTIVLSASLAAVPAPTTGRRKSKKPVTKRNNHLLPDDMHFSSVQLLRLFLKPKFTLKMRRYSGRDGGVAADPNGNGDGEIDENFWAQAAAAHAENTNDNDGEDGSGQVPFNTQFFHDDYDDAAGYDEDFIDNELGGDSGAMDDEELLAATQGQLKRTRPEFVNYAKRAKRVDVRKLKENIWKNLDIVVDKKTANDAEDEEHDEATEETRPLSDPTEARRFTNVIEGLKITYPKDKMDEISTSFCFICLLHLANEQGLKLEVAQDGNSQNDEHLEVAEGEDDVDAQKRVGNIWGVKVYRDPNATQSA